MDLFIFSMALLRLMLSFTFLNIWNIVIIKRLKCLCVLIVLSAISFFLSFFLSFFFLRAAPTAYGSSWTRG